ncbi:PREDICTED: uncharacterized protein C17orf62 homolog isoform X3 [Chinchilla lanigera]|uniref:uncharacterized protein C17orf62 homolog isoform X3 n=1 Tax=Chinchilla lanigera TaxID=34839 RepID=UPI000697F490|nr:PREDICTED: uncharacterized protein C17orf62 homolog isoform X3 [Chinchilla lanigera]
MADPPPEDHAALSKPRKSLRPSRQTRKPLRLPRPLADLICWLRCWCGHPGDVRPRAPTHPPAQVALSTSSRPGALGRSGLSRPGQLPVQTPSRMYMRVETRTSSCLHLKRAPGIRSWSLLVGILSTGLAAAYYSGGSHLQQEHWEGHFENVQPLQEAADPS